MFDQTCVVSCEPMRQAQVHEVGEFGEMEAFNAYAFGRGNPEGAKRLALRAEDVAHVPLRGVLGVETQLENEVLQAFNEHQEPHYAVVVVLGRVGAEVGQAESGDIERAFLRWTLGNPKKGMAMVWFLDSPGSTMSCCHLH